MNRRPSPVFLGLVAATLASGWLCWTDPWGRNTKYALFLFVLLGWIVSLCLHEYAHARTAFWAGDEMVEARGYLTLNPLKYLQPGISLLLPVLFLLLGGIGLPGGAVWIRPGAIRTPMQRSLVSLAGPASNLVLGIVLASIVSLGGDAMQSHPYFGSALSFLALLQFTAGILNLLPIPGLDGFGAIEPHLNRSTLEAIAPYRGYSMIVLLLLATRSSAFNNLVFGNADRLVDFFGVPDYKDTGFSLADLGAGLFRSALPEALTSFTSGRSRSTG